MTSEDLAIIDMFNRWDSPQSGWRSCSPTTRGVWTSLLVLLRARSVCSLTQPLPQLARLLHLTAAELELTLAELSSTKVAEVHWRQDPAVTPMSRSEPPDRAGCHTTVTVICVELRAIVEERKAAAERQKRRRAGGQAGQDGGCHSAVTPLSRSAGGAPSSSSEDLSGVLVSPGITEQNQQPNTPERQRARAPEPARHAAVTPKRAPRPAATPDCPIVPLLLDTDRFRAAWAEWLRYRQVEQRNPVTPLSASRQLDQFLTWGEDRAIAAIHHTIRSGWIGLREPELARSARTPDAHRTAKRSAEFTETGPAAPRLA